MPLLTIRFKKKSDGGVALSCTRADGTVAWQSYDGATGQFFPRHDLTHYAVETVLGHRRGFYGLVADGWEFSDFGTPWPRGPLPADTDPSELIVGLLDAERASHAQWSVAEFGEAGVQCLAASGMAGALSDRLLTGEQLERIRARRQELFARWDGLATGEALELVFDPGPAGVG